MTAALLALWLGGGLVDSLPPAEKLEISINAWSGTGASVAGTGGQTFVRRSPLFMHLDVGITHPQISWLEFAPALLLELEGRVGVGLEAKVRAYLPLRRRIVYATIGLPVFVAPYSLIGARGGLGMLLSLHKHFGFMLEASAAAFVWGSDLAKGTALGKIDGSAGVRFSF